MAEISELDLRAKSMALGLKNSCGHERKAPIFMWVRHKSARHGISLRRRTQFSSDRRRDMEDATVVVSSFFKVVAEVDLKEAVELNKKNANPLCMLAPCYKEKGMSVEAHRAFQQALEVDSH